MVHPDHLAVVELESVLEHTREQVQLGLPGGHRRGQAVNPIPNVQQQEHDRGGGVELSPLGVRLVHLLDCAAKQVGVEAEAVAKNLDVRDLDVDLPLVGVGEIDGTLACVITHAGGHLGAATQVDVHRLKEGFPSVSQEKSPVEALGVLQAHLLPAWVSVLAKGHAPALGVAPTEGVDVNKEHGINAAVPHLTDLHGEPDDHV